MFRVYVYLPEGNRVKNDDSHWFSIATVDGQNPAPVVNYIGIPKRNTVITILLFNIAMENHHF